MLFSFCCEQSYYRPSSECFHKFWNSNSTEYFLNRIWDLGKTFVATKKAVWVSSLIFRRKYILSLTVSSWNLPLCFLPLPCKFKCPKVSDLRVKSFTLKFTDFYKQSYKIMLYTSASPAIMNAKQWEAYGYEPCERGRTDQNKKKGCACSISLKSCKAKRVSTARVRRGLISWTASVKSL